jgi:DNA invertase Pin-like site-specific DNA recombinase
METLIYCRVSSKEQAETGYSLHQQEQASKKFIEKSGFVLGKIFIESGESAKTQDRTELQKMLKYMKSNVGHVTGLVVWKLDRLSRELYDFKSLELRLSKMGIMIHSVTEPNDLNAVGKLSRNMTASFAQFENDQKSERTIAVMQQACKDGRWCWKAPLGYKRVKEKGHSIIAIDTENAIYVQKAFEMAETNTYSKEEIRRELQAMGLPNLKKDKLTKMLNNVLYMGKLKVSWFPNLIDAIHEPIITKSQFYKVQKIMLARRKGGINKSSNNSEFPLKKILRCGLCGERITGSKSTGGGGSKYAYYHCSSKKNCSIRTPKAELEEKFYCLLNDMILRDNALKATIASITSEFDSQKKRQQQLIKQIKGEMQREKQRKNRLLDFMLDGTLGEDGLLQAYLEMINIPYSSCNVLTSAICFNKDICKQFLKPHNIPMAKSLMIKMFLFLFPKDLLNVFFTQKILQIRVI